MNKKLNQLINLLKRKLGLFLSISFGVFLFVLFFQPFPPDMVDFNNRVLFVAGLGGIVFLFTVVVDIGFSLMIRNNGQTNHDSVMPGPLIGFLLLALNSVAFAFYLRYVGGVSISFSMMLKVVLICLAPPVIIAVYDAMTELRQQNAALILEKKIIRKQIEKYEEDYLNKSLEFVSENSTENMTLLVADVALIKSADNYVEIVYTEGAAFKKKLIRNTLKNIELQLKAYTNFIRCHRICIVNTHYIEKLNRSDSTHWLTIQGYDEEIPVSRQYLLKLKETL